MDRYDVLEQYFGHSAFRPGQEALIDAILSGRDALGIMPTGGGKSLCYQVPAIAMDGVVLVISPLISLMKDQVTALKQLGIHAAFVNSSLGPEEFYAVCRDIRAGRCKLIYAAPERLMTEGFAEMMQQQKLSLVAVDEAHCISQWGQDFRPSYLKIADFLDTLPHRPVVAAFTATATELVREDILRILRLRDPEVVITGFDRPNLYYEVAKPKHKNTALLELLEQRPGQSGIVYCATRSTVEKVCEFLQAHGLRATRYHAGLDDDERRENQEDFIYDRCTVMVATNAFGMGIDKSNVSFVIHYNMPKSLESYYQEAGRAGRDGEAADCILLYSAGDVQTAKFLILNSSDNEALTEEERQAVVLQDLKRLDAMTGYCKTSRCLRGYLLDYFGQSHEPTCRNCGSCLTETTFVDITTQAQMILSCIKRIYDKLGYSVGALLVVRTLCGSRDKRVLELGLDTLPTYGLMKGVKKEQIRAWLDHLEAEELIFTDPIHGGIVLLQKAGEILFHRKQMLMPVKAPPVPSPAEVPTPKAQAPDEALLSVLKSLRLRIAKEEKVPAYIIFTNAALADMAKKQPRTMAQFLTVSGVGAVKAEKYGEAFLDAINAYSIP